MKRTRERGISCNFMARDSKLIEKKIEEPTAQPIVYTQVHTHCDGNKRGREGDDDSAQYLS